MPTYSTEIPISNNVRIQGQLIVEGSISAPNAALNEEIFAAGTAIPRSKLAEDALQLHAVPITGLRVWDAMHTTLPGTAADDDLALIGGTFGSASPVVRTSDAKATSVTQYARFLFTLPHNFVSAGDVTLRVFAGMNTTVSDTTATVDVQCYEANKSAGVGSDLCTTSATTINSLTGANKDFSITATGLAAGDVLDVRITIAITDGATATAVIGQIGSIDVLADVRG